MPCSYCRLRGHNYSTCPSLTPEQIKEMKDKKKQKKEMAALARLEKQKQNTRVYYQLINTTDYELVMYWGMNDSHTLHKFSYCGPHSVKPMNCLKYKHRIVIYPFLEVCENGGVNAKNTIHINSSGEAPYIHVFDQCMEDYENENITIDVKYEPPKTELDQWKGLALKSYFLLEQIVKISSKKEEDGEIVVNERFEPIEPFIQMVEDISIPDSCNEYDKEMAGIPSHLTNIT